MENETTETVETPEVKKEMTIEELRATMGLYKNPAIKVDEKTNEETKESGTSNIEHANEAQPGNNSSSSEDKDAPFGRFANGKPRKKPAKNSPPNVATASDLKDQETAKIEAGILIDGAMFLLLINMLVPLVLSSLNNYLAKDKIKPEQIELTKDQEKKFAPIVDKCMQGLMMTGDPKWVLFFGLATVFGMNYMMAKMNAE